MLKEALSAYGLSGANTLLLGHSENLTYRVNSPKGRYVLRIHQPKVGMATAVFDGGHSPIDLRRTEPMRHGGMRLPLMQDSRWVCLA